MASGLPLLLLHVLNLVLVLVPVLVLVLVPESCWGSEVRSEELGDAVRHGADQEPRVFTHGHRDMVSINMFKVFDKYSKKAPGQRDANTVRSFKAQPRVVDGRDVFQFNLSTLQDSELILSASFHFLYKRPRHHQHHHHHQHHQHQQHQHHHHQQRPWRFRKPRHPSGGVRPPLPQLLFLGSSNAALGNVTLAPFRKGSWQTRDVTSVLQHARDVKQLVLAVEIDLGFGATRGPQRNVPDRLSPANLPYILINADDRAIDQPNSVAVSLQRYGPFPVAEDAAAASRIRRELHQTNDIPEAEYNTLKNHELWQNTFFPAKAAAKPGRKAAAEGGEGLGKPQVLSFDERTMKKARRRQWSEPRVCSRRYLRVDFADIGWSEWVLAPKSFDAFYCAGACGFPIPKVVRPSNHATIQSIVRAVGIVPGVPEPCCVPEKTSPLSVLFLDTSRNMVLKVYPGMSVDTCACR